MITYDDIARLIEPVAKRFEDYHYTTLSIGACTVERSPDIEWHCAPVGPSLCEEALADLACMELVRRLNANGWNVIHEARGWVEFMQLRGETWHGKEMPYTHHPLEAIAPFAAEVLK